MNMCMHWVQGKGATTSCTVLRGKAGLQKLLLREHIGIGTSTGMRSFSHP